MTCRRFFFGMLEVQAEKIFALTGCTAVCLVCYVIPVFIHLAVQLDEQRLLDEQSHSVEPTITIDPLHEPLLHATGGLNVDLVDDISALAAAAAQQQQQPKVQGCSRVTVAAAAVWRLIIRYMLPAVVVAIGVGFSLAGLYVGFNDLMSYLDNGGSGGGGVGSTTWMGGTFPSAPVPRDDISDVSDFH